MKIKFFVNYPIRFGGYFLAPDKNGECELPHQISGPNNLRELLKRYVNVVGLIDESESPESTEDKGPKEPEVDENPDNSPKDTEDKGPKEPEVDENPDNSPEGKEPEVDGGKSSESPEDTDDKGPKVDENPDESPENKEHKVDGESDESPEVNESKSEDNSESTDGSDNKEA